jgi:phosphoribosylaminoimidazole-succinocarboxamide synthase
MGHAARKLPKLPDEIIEKTAARYREILGILTG